MTKPDPSWVHVHNKDEMEAFYRGVLPNIITEAKYHGYAIGLHGSLRRDLDLIAVPWTDDHSDKDELARAVQEAACGMPSAKYQWEEKPCGRWAASFPICWTEMTNELSLGHIDLSVMASVRPEALRNPQDEAVRAAWDELLEKVAIQAVLPPKKGYDRRAIYLCVEDENDHGGEYVEVYDVSMEELNLLRGLLCAPSPRGKLP